MGTLIQKKISITNEQKQFLENYRKWGFSDQSSIIREALSLFISELETREKKALMTQKAQELLSDYAKDKDFVAFTDLDGEDFL